MNNKSPEDHFVDWEGHFFGFGYGTGQRHTIPALRRFLELCPENGCNYDYEVLEAELTPTVAWLLINTICAADILEYGTSPRYAWLTAKGQRLRAFMLSKSVDELIVLTCRPEDYMPCHSDACNCGPNGYEKGRVCQNPFWLDPRP